MSACSARCGRVPWVAGILAERKLEEGVQLHALAAEPRVVEQQAAGADVAGADERRERHARSSRAAARTRRLRSLRS